MINYEKLLKNLEAAQCDFHEEIQTEENSDYRLGYYAGRLSALLEIKGDLIDE